MKKILLLSVAMLLVGFNAFAQTAATSCGNLSTTSQVCGSASLTAVAGGAGAGSGGRMGCLATTPNQSWFFVVIGASGTVAIPVSIAPTNDVDFAAWGPFNSIAAAQTGCTDITNNSGSTSTSTSPCNDNTCIGNLVSCDYSSTNGGTLQINSAVAGQIYAILIANFTGAAGQITLGANSGTGTITCAAPAPPCAISAISSGTQTPCTGTNPNYSQELTITYANAPTTGNLVVNGQTFPVTTSPQTVTLAGLVPSGTAVNVTANFSTNTTCTFTQAAAFTAPQPCCPAFTLASVGPASGKVCEGDVINLSASHAGTYVAENDYANLQWEVSTNGGAFSPITAATTASANYTVPAGVCGAKNVIFRLKMDCKRTVVSCTPTAATALTCVAATAGSTGAISNGVTANVYTFAPAITPSQCGSTPAVTSASVTSLGGTTANGSFRSEVRMVADAPNAAAATAVAPFTGAGGTATSLNGANIPAGYAAGTNPVGNWTLSFTESLNDSGTGTDFTFGSGTGVPTNICLTVNYTYNVASTQTFTNTSNPNIIATSAPAVQVFHKPVIGVDFTAPCASPGVTNICPGDVAMYSPTATPASEADYSSATPVQIANTVYYIVNTPGAPAGCSTTGSANKSVACPLSVQLVSFSASYNASNKSNILNWITASEQNNSHFEVEKSINGIEFKAIGQVKGNGTSVVEHKYQFTDKNIVSGTSFYRLKQMDFDGTSNFSNTIVLTQKGDLQLINIAPNPAKQNMIATVYTPTSSEIMVEIRDILGKIIVQKSQTVKEGNNSINFEVSDYANGLYHILVIDQKNATKSTQKFIKE